MRSEGEGSWGGMWLGGRVVVLSVGRVVVLSVGRESAKSGNPMFVFLVNYIIFWVSLDK